MVTEVLRRESLFLSRVVISGKLLLGLESKSSIAGL